jgi:protein phosphatase
MVADGLVAVADGMGGHLAGEVASADTVTTLQAVVGMREPGELVGAVHLANRRIHDRAAENPELHGMGTTVCVLGTVVDDGLEQLMVLNVGDSRIYHYGSGVLTQITEDHSLVEALVRDGRLTPEEAEVHPQRNVLTRALGVEAVVEVDSWLLTPADGDRFLLCSDGLFNEITNQQIAEVLESAKDPDTAARILSERAETAGGRDNITTVVVDVTGTGLAAGPVDERLRRVVVPPADLSDIEALLVAAQDESDEIDETADVDTTANLPPVVATLADDDAAFEAETPAEVAARDATDDLPTADDEPVVVADAVERDGWRSKLFLLAVVAVVLVGVAAIVIGIIASGSDLTTTTTVRPTTTVSSTTVSTATTLPVVTVPTTLPLTPAPPVTAAPTAPGT